MWTMEKFEYLYTPQSHSILHSTESLHTSLHSSRFCSYFSASPNESPSAGIFSRQIVRMLGIHRRARRRTTPPTGSRMPFNVRGYVNGNRAAKNQSIANYKARSTGVFVHFIIQNKLKHMTKTSANQQRGPCDSMQLCRGHPLSLHNF